MLIESCYNYDTDTSLVEGVAVVRQDDSFLSEFPASSNNGHVLRRKIEGEAQI